MNYEPLSFTPMSDKQIEDASPRMKPGIADFQVLSAEQKKSQSGNPMIQVKLKVFDEDGKEGTVNDFLLTTEKMQWKLKSFCRSAGLLDNYEKGSLGAEDIFSKSGKCKIKPQKDKPQYMEIAEYMVMDAKDKPEEYKKAKAEAVVDADFDDDIPF